MRTRDRRRGGLGRCALVLGGLLWFFGGLGRAAELQVFAAASLSDALTEIGPAYEAVSGNRVRFNFAGSNALARQIQEGAPADVFVSADEARMDAVAKAGLLSEGTRRVLLSNVLVVVVAAESRLEIASAAALAQPGVARLALADPRGVPAGVYARAWLEKSGTWDAVKARVVPTENVRAALAAVASGNADAGVVYRTDAGISRAVRVAYVVPTDAAPAIAYPAAVIKASPHAPAARRLLDYLGGEAAGAVFKRHGFLVPN